MPATRQAYHTPFEGRLRPRKHRNCARGEGIFKHMALLARMTAPRGGKLLCGASLALLALAATLVALLPAATQAASRTTTAKRAIDTHALYRSRLLWSTINVCNPSDQPNTVGIRGSMPGDSQAHDKMYMRFRLQYLNATTNQWADLAKSASGFVSVGTGASPRQAGRSFQLSPVVGQPAFTLRGVVTFQWRQGTAVVAQTSRPTSGGRESLAGADPAGFSAAHCLIG
jgi:hypothetical protein